MTDVIRSKGHGVIAYNNAHRSSHASKFINLRAEDHWSLRVNLEHGRVALPRDEKLAEELLAVEYTLVAGGAIQVLSKDHIKKAIGRSRDTGDSVIMGLGETVASERRYARWFDVRLSW